MVSHFVAVYICQNKITPQPSLLLQVYVEAHISTRPKLTILQFSFLKEHLVDEFAQSFQQQGIAALIYDHRSWGSSDGIPANHVDFQQQAHDYSDAISFLATHNSEIDASRIAIMGLGHSAGVIMQVAALDPRVKAVISQAPFISGKHESQFFPPGLWEKVWEERQARAQDPSRDYEYVPLFANNLEEAKANPACGLLGNELVYAFSVKMRARSDAAGTPWPNKATLQSLYHQKLWEPTTYLPSVTAPYLYVSAKHDEFTPRALHLKAFESIGGVKELTELETTNLETMNGVHMQDSKRRHVEFLKKHLS